MMDQSTNRSLLLVCLIGLTWMFWTQAWMVDDAYITLRTVDNFVNGLGLTWNPIERVQAYTHPLWMFALSALYFVTREHFIVPLVFSFALLLLMIFYVRKRFASDAAWKIFLFVGLLVVSKAFFDYTSSGLENPLTHLLVVVFYGMWLLDPVEDPEARLKRYPRLLLVAALAFFNRIDTLLMFMPALTWETIALARVSGPRRVIKPFVLGTLPATGWLAFSLVYYGAPFPNTAYAKALGNGIDPLAFWQLGGVYFLNSLEWDPATLVFMGLALLWALQRREKATLLAAAGMLLYLVYIAKLGAGGTHMSGRFFSAPYLIAALILLHSLKHLREAAPVAALAVAFVFLSPGAPLKSAGNRTTLGHNGLGRSGIIDTRWFVHNQGAALLSWERGRRWPNHGWYSQGLEYKKKKGTVHVGGAGGGAGIGYFSFASGPSKYIVDGYALTDPLLARLPIQKGTEWSGGHFRRDIPTGYVASVEDGVNRIEDPDLRAFYDHILLITRGPIFDGERFASIWKLHTGQLAPLVSAYATRAESPEEKAPNLAPSPRERIRTRQATAKEAERLELPPGPQDGLQQGTQEGTEPR